MPKVVTSCRIEMLVFIQPPKVGKMFFFPRGMNSQKFCYRQMISDGLVPQLVEYPWTSPMWSFWSSEPEKLGKVVKKKLPQCAYITSYCMVSSGFLDARVTCLESWSETPPLLGQKNGVWIRLKIHTLPSSLGKAMNCYNCVLTTENWHPSLTCKLAEDDMI